MGYHYRGPYKSGYRSGLEESVSKDLEALSVPFEYEKYKIKYKIPEKEHTYTPDFKLPNNIFIETKGVFTPEDRQKHLLIKEQHPEIDIRFVFQNPGTKLNKRSKTTYADWCKKHGFQYAAKTIPRIWLKEPRRDL